METSVKLEAKTYESLIGTQEDKSKRKKKEQKSEGDLTYANAEFDSMYGKILSIWRIINDKNTRFEYSVTIPPNTSAKVILKKILKGGTFILDTRLHHLTEISNLSINDEQTEFELVSGTYSIALIKN